MITEEIFEVGQKCEKAGYYLACARSDGKPTGERYYHELTDEFHARVHVQDVGEQRVFWIWDNDQSRKS